MYGLFVRLPACLPAYLCRFEGFIPKGYRVGRPGAVFGYRAESELLISQRRTGRGLSRFRRAVSTRVACLRYACVLLPRMMHTLH